MPSRPVVRLRRDCTDVYRAAIERLLHTLIDDINPFAERSTAANVAGFLRVLRSARPKGEPHGQAPASPPDPSRRSGQPIDGEPTGMLRARDARV